MNTTLIPPDEHGFLRHWMIAGPTETPYTGPTDGGDDAMRFGAIDPTILPAPDAAVLDQPGPDGLPWQWHDPGHNVFIERSSFWFSLTHVRAWFAAEVHADQPIALPAWLWAAGCADLYCNGQHIARNNCPRYMYPQRQRVELPLRAGANQLAVRLQVLGLRDSRLLFGLRCEDPAAPITSRGLAQIAHTAPPPPQRPADTPAAPFPRGTGGDPADRVQALIEGALQQHTTVMDNETVTLAHGPLAARAIGRQRDHDTDLITKTCDWVDGRPDCADFAMAALLRMAALDLLSEPERRRIRQTALAFRYWTDESGNDAMCFTSENHRLLFHSAQLLAGRLWPDERFPAADRTGAEQAAVGLERCKAWLTVAETHGFKEYLSAGYIPITVAALMNLVDCAGDPDTAKRATALVDTTFRTLADHAYDGIVIAPQGRVYRQVLQPESSGTQALLAFAAEQAVVAHDIWLGFLASSPTYHPPTDLLDRMQQPAHREYRQHTVDIVLHKTADYILTSVHIDPAQPRCDDPSEDHDREYAAGLAGYQQHLWHASLGQRCHVFVNHPGEWIDHGKARPGYWYGNGILPRTQQRDNRLMQIFRIDDEHPVPFVHAHWPADVFDETHAADGWHAARKDDGYIALWCSAPLVACDDAIVGRELRAWSPTSAWLCLCASARDHANLTAFLQHCQSLTPSYNETDNTLRLSDGTMMSWASP